MHNPPFMDDPVHRYLEAQNAGLPSAFDRALIELRSGRKCTHWIWYVLPQLQGLGRSAKAQRYGLRGIEEAKTYLAHPLLLSRLMGVIAVISDQLEHPSQTLELLMGSSLDAAKTISSLTLFEAAGLETASGLLDRLGRRCSKTKILLSTPPTRISN